jgi:hypothetical protein
VAINWSRGGGEEVAGSDVGDSSSRAAAGAAIGESSGELERGVAREC